MASHTPAPLNNRETLTGSLTRLLQRPVDRSTRHRAALHVLDWLGCALIGTRQTAGRPFVAGTAGLAPGAAALISGRRVSGRAAAFTNAAFGSILEMDDVNKSALLHPGPVIIPAALAAAEATDADAAALLDAIVRGYEAMIRLGRALGAGHYRFFHPTATAGSFGAAAAVADLLGLSMEGWVSALGNAGSQAGGLWQCRHEPVMTKQWHTARAAEGGYAAAEMAGWGLTGPAAILEGPQGMFAAMAPDARPEIVLSMPEGPWLIGETSIKPWPACRHVHAAIDAALLLREQLRGREIAAVSVETFGDAMVFCDRASPRTPQEARFSLQHAVAIALLDGPPTLASFESAAIRRADVAALRCKVVPQACQPFTSRYPARFGSAVAATLEDGSHFQVATDDALGDPENPLPDEALVGKARMLMEAAAIDSNRVSAIIAATRALADGGKVRDLTDLLVAGADA